MTNTDTCNLKCPYWKKWKENCPNYMKTGWRAAEGGQPIYLNDCAPKRSVLMHQDLTERFLGWQKASEEERNLQTNNAKLLLAHIGQLTDDVPQIEFSEDAKVLQIEEKNEDND